MAKLTKQELIEQFSLYETIASKAEAGRIYDHLISIIKSNLTAGNSVALGNDFGTLDIRTSAARTGLVPGTTTGQTYSSPAKQTVRFKPSIVLKTAIAGD